MRLIFEETTMLWFNIVLILTAAGLSSSQRHWTDNLEAIETTQRELISRLDALEANQTIQSEIMSRLHILETNSHIQNEIVSRLDAIEANQTIQSEIMSRLDAIEANQTVQSEIISRFDALETNNHIQNDIVSRLDVTARLDALVATDVRIISQLNRLNAQSLQLDGMSNYPVTCYLDSCYVLLKTGKSWNNAQDTCEARSGNLVALESPMENAFIKEWALPLSGNYHIWIGANDRYNEGNWKWVGQNTEAQWLDWADGEPNSDGGNEDCVEMYRSGHKNDNDCRFENYFICEFELN